MIPPCSWATPGRKPGTSSNVTRGTLNASQNRMNRAPLSEALISSTPASTAGWFATTPTGRPPVGVRAAEALEVDLFVGHGLHDARPGDEHVGNAAHHEDEVGDGRTVHRAAGARTQDGADLRYHARGERVAQKDVGVAAERRDPLLNARATRVVEPDQRRAVLEGQIHHLADLFRVRLGERAP